MHNVEDNKKLFLLTCNDEIVGMLKEAERQRATLESFHPFANIWWNLFLFWYYLSSQIFSTGMHAMITTFEMSRFRNDFTINSYSKIRLLVVRERLH